MLTTFPGLCDLLPAANLCKDFDPFDPDQWPDGPKPAARLLEYSRDAMADLPPPDERFRLIAGFGQDTVLGLRRVGRKLEFGRGPAGDGTVPLALAQWPALKTWYAEENHGSLPGHADVGRAIADLARSGTTTALPGVLPRHRGASTLWQEDLRSAPEPKIAWNDLSEREQREFLHEFVGVTQPSTTTATPKRVAAAKPVELSFMEGSITHSNAAAIVLGAFANVEPAGAAQAIDKLLHGAISDLARRRAINAAAGEVFVLPVGRSGLAPRLVVFAGLGNFGRYGPDVQRLAAANVTRTLALAGIENFAMVLWGTSSGAEPADAARAQLEGVLTALADLAPEQRLKRITIVSRDADRLGTARRVAEDLLRLHSAAPLVRIARDRKSTRKAVRPPKPTATPVAWLFVQESAAILRVALLGPAPKATALVASRRLDLRLLEREHSRLVPGMSVAELEEFGERLAGLLLPTEIVEALPSVKSSPLVVVHDTASAHWPWETLSIKGWAPAAASGLSRRYAAEGMSVAKWREQRTMIARIQRAARDQPHRRPAGRSRGRRARRRDADAASRRRHHGDPRRRRDTRAPARGVPFGRLRRNPLRRPCLVRSRGACVERHPLRRRARALGGRPRGDGFRAGARLLQCLRIRALAPTVNPLRQLDRSVGFAEAFLRGGVANFVGTWWPVSDAAASAFATTLYRDLAKGESIGNALNAARASVRAAAFSRLGELPALRQLRLHAEAAKGLSLDQGDVHLARGEQGERPLGLPGIANAVGDRRLAVRGDLHRELDRARVLLLGRLRLLDQRPLAPAIEVLAHDHLDRLRLVVADLDLEGLFHDAALACSR